MADEIEGVRSAAWHALCAALTRYGYVEPDDLPGRPLAEAFVEAFAERGYAVTEVGRLLPPGGEVSTQWAVRFTELLGHHASYVQPYAYEHNAREYAAADWRPHRTGELVNRRVTTWSDGTKLVGPWSPVVSDNSEEKSDHEHH